nr:type II toxin-antitoxin system HicA family toxin [uncultured Methanoregula sp.]
MLSWKDLLRVFSKLGYHLVRQRGSHAQLKCITPAGEHTITIPLHDEIATGTLNDIISRVSIWKGISKDELIRMLK